jgi:hypothetical protein
VCRLRAVRRDAGASRHACSNERNEVKDAEMARRADARRKANMELKVCTGALTARVAAAGMDSAAVGSDLR